VTLPTSILRRSLLAAAMLMLVPLRPAVGAQSGRPGAYGRRTRRLLCASRGMGLYRA
jgi:hypothetical protein